MDITCNKCGKEYSLDETLVSSKGTAVRCTNCNHVFKAYKEESEAGPDEWFLKKAHGASLTIDSISVLKQWISEGKVSENDLLSKNRGPWKRIADIPELKQFFSKTRSQKATAAGFVGSEESDVETTIKKSPRRSLQNREMTARQVIFSNAKSDDNERIKETRSYQRPSLEDDKTTLPPNPPVEDELDNKTTTNLVAVQQSSNPPQEDAMGTSSSQALTNDAAGPRASHSNIDPQKPDDPDLSQIPASKDDTNWNTGARIDVTGPAWAQKTGSLPKYRSDKDSRPDTSHKLVTWLIIGLVVLSAGVGLLIFLTVPDTADQVTDQLAGMVSSSEQERFQQFFDRGQEKFLLDTEKAYLQADREFQKVLALQDKHPATLAALGQMYGVWAQYLRDQLVDTQSELSAEDAQKTSRIQPETERLKKEFAAKNAEAIQWAKQALAVAPTLKEAHLAMADAKRLEGNLVEAKQHLNTAKVQGEDATTRYVSVLIDMDEGKSPADLLQNLEQVVGEKPLIRAMYRQARILASTDKKKEADKIIDSLFELNTNHQPSRELREKLQSAVPIRLSSDGPVGRAQPKIARNKPPGKAESKADDQQDTSSHATDDTAEAPEEAGDFATLLTKAKRHLDKGRSSKAKELFEKILEDNPKEPDALSGLAYCYLDRGQKGRAISHFRRVLSEHRSHGPALIGLAETYRMSGEKRQALKYYRQYLEKNPSGREAGLAKTNVDRLQADLDDEAGSESKEAEPLEKKEESPSEPVTPESKNEEPPPPAPADSPQNSDKPSEKAPPAPAESPEE